jgi:hypothetical protein
MMAKFLNVSDGMIKLPGKKTIFTTNLDNIRNVDSALICSGRCFDVLTFRAFTYNEAIDVCRVANLLDPHPNTTTPLG